MHLVVKRNGGIVNEFRFERGPVYIGRAAHSQVLLPDLAVSRQHAAIFATPDGKWMVEDMNSANQTLLNGEEVHSAEIKTGDCLRIADFVIEIDLEAGTDSIAKLQLDETLITAADKSPAEIKSKVIIRKPDSLHAPDVTLQSSRIKDFLKATEEICKANNTDALLAVLVKISLNQLRADQCWCALRNLPEGPMTSHAGRSGDGRVLELTSIKLNEVITQAVDKQEFVLLPQIPAEFAESRINSAIITPLIEPTGCFGVIYIARIADSPNYQLSDLDYLMLLSIHTAAILENF